MKQNILKAVVLAAGLLGIIGCSDDSQQSTIYMPGAGATEKVKYAISDEPYMQMFNVAITPSEYPQLTPSGFADDVTVHLSADLDKVTEYNEKNGTNYKVMPQGSYTVQESVLIKAGKAKSENAILTLHAKGVVEPFVEYLLPISISGVEGAAPDNCCQTVYFLLYGAIDASGMKLLDRTRWEALSASSEEPKEGDWGHSGLKEGCLDGNLVTFWGTDWSNKHPQPPHWIVIDLKESLFIQGFACQAREEGYDGPKEVIVEVSDDNTTWEVAAKFKDIPAQNEFRSFFPKAVNGRYLKVTITAVNGGPHVTVSEINLF